MKLAIWKAEASPRLGIYDALTEGRSPDPVDVRYVASAYVAEGRRIDGLLLFKALSHYGSASPDRGFDELCKGLVSDASEPERIAARGLMRARNSFLWQTLEATIDDAPAGPIADRWRVLMQAERLLRAEELPSRRLWSEWALWLITQDEQEAAYHAWSGLAEPPASLARAAAVASGTERSFATALVARMAPRSSARTARTVRWLWQASGTPWRTSASNHQDTENDCGQQD